jgi:signal transduction histidine kinase
MKKLRQSITIGNVKVLNSIARWFDRHPTSTDGMVALALSALAALDLYINWAVNASIPEILGMALTALAIWPLTYRRRYPLAVLLVMTAGVVIYRSLSIPESDFILYSLLLGFFSAGAYGDRRWRNWARAISALVTIGLLTYSVFFVGRSYIFPAQTVLYQLSVVLLNIFLFGGAWWIGDVFRIRRQRELELGERTVQLEKERDENARRAVLDERVRIARELHDVVAHHVSVMGIQAGAARRILKQQPEKANEVLSQIEASSREAVAELQRLLGFLRQHSQTDELAPQPTLRQLDLLISHMREAGLPVEVRIEGEPRTLPPGVDLSAYRIVQEALTNTLKHAGPARATVTLRYDSGAISIEILDNGHGPEESENVEIKGRGLIGMRERVSLHGGEFTAGKAAGAGFAVRARLPLTGAL